MRAYIAVNAGSSIANPTLVSGPVASSVPCAVWSVDTETSTVLACGSYPIWNVDYNCLGGGVPAGALCSLIRSLQSDRWGVIGFPGWTSLMKDGAAVDGQQFMKNL